MTPEQELLEAQITIDDLRARLAVAEQRAEAAMRERDFAYKLCGGSHRSQREFTDWRCDHHPNTRLSVMSTTEQDGGTSGTLACVDCVREKATNPERQRADAAEQELALMTQAVGLASTLKSSMLIRVDDPIGMMQEVHEYVAAALSDNARLREALGRVRKHYTTQHSHRVTADEVMDVIDALLYNPDGVYAALATPNAAPSGIGAVPLTTEQIVGSPAGCVTVAPYPTSLLTPPRERTAAEERERCAAMVEALKKTVSRRFTGQIVDWLRRELDVLAAAMRKEPE